MDHDGHEQTEESDRSGFPLDVLFKANPPIGDRTLPSTDSLAPVEAVDHYRMLGEIGRGGMGVVHAARDTKLGRKVAIKVLHARGQAALQRRLMREAMAMAKLSHPNVVPIYEVREQAGATFLIMEYIEGATLRAWLEHPRALDEIIDVFTEAARGLSAAHEQGLIHRDFKPDNVMVGDDGRVRVMDFGLARTSEELLETNDASALTCAETQVELEVFTHTGALLGTPAYMAPEQLRAEPASPTSDQFSFCVALYEAVYGQRPFVASTIRELRKLVEQGAMSAPPKHAGVPAWLDAVLMRGLEPEPRDRFESIRALLDALEHGRSRSVLRWIRPREWSSRTMGRLGAGLVAGLTGLAAAALLRPTSPPPPVPVAAPVSERTPAAPSPASDTASDERLAQEALAPLLAIDNDDNDDDERLRLAADYLAAFAERGGAGRQLIAEAVRGEILWRRSCPEARAGLCIATSPNRDRRHRCERHANVARIQRSEVTEPALNHLRLAASLALTTPTLDDPREALALTDAIATVQTLLGDAALEAYLDIRPPLRSDLAPTGDDAPRETFATFLDLKLPAAEDVVAAYAEVGASGRPRWIAEAAARTAVVYTDLGNSLMSLPLASSLTRAERRAYCESLTDQVAPFRAMAEAARTDCVAKFEASGLEPRRCAAATLSASTPMAPTATLATSATPNSLTDSQRDTVEAELGLRPGQTDHMSDAEIEARRDEHIDELSRRVKQPVAGFVADPMHRSDRGVAIGTIQRGGPADHAGLRPGDLILRVGGRELGRSIEDVYGAFAGTQVGVPVEVVYMREGVEHTTMLTPAERWG